MEKEIKRFIDYLTYIKHYSDKTTSSYLFDLKKFEKYLIENKIKVDEVTSEDVSDYMNNLKKNNYKATSINRKIVCLRSFYKYYCNEINNNFKNPMINYLSLKTPKKLPKDLFDEQVKALLTPCENKIHYQVRNQCIILLLLNTGMRVSELTSLNIIDLDIQANCIRVFGKGKKERMVFFLKSVNPFLIDYLKNHRSKFTSDNSQEALFLGSKGGRISTRAIEDILNARMKNSSLSFKVTPHMLRHTFATNLLNNEVDLKIVQELLGHASLAATQIYTHVSKERLKKVYEKTHPLAKVIKS